MDQKYLKSLSVTQTSEKKDLTLNTQKRAL